MTKHRSIPTVLELEGDNQQLANFCGALDENIRQIAQAWDVHISRNGHRFTLTGGKEKVASAKSALQIFFRRALHQPLSLEALQLGLAEMRAEQASKFAQVRQREAAESTSGDAAEADSVSPEVLSSAEQSGGGDHVLVAGNEVSDPLQLRTKRSDLRPRTPNQRTYLQQILRHDITFGVGPAGTGKTFLAVACAIDALERDNVQRIILARPAVEAGERLGFLPGDLSQKVDPYLRPLYDALYDLMGFDKVQRLMEKQTIELAPLAYMRGRTLNHAFVILDEAQNTTPEQMKMFLTRIGFGSKAVITGDPSQVDLPRGQTSGLAHACSLLRRVQGIAVQEFTSKDVVRHPLVARIIDAYEGKKD